MLQKVNNLLIFIFTDILAFLVHLHEAVMALLRDFARKNDVLSSLYVARACSTLSFSGFVVCSAVVPEDHDHSSSLFYVWKSYWKQVGSVPWFTTSRVHGRVRMIKFG